MKLSHISSKKRGFTLIELLIVIGILGILAAGLLAAIDPLEQLKRGRDTQRRNVTVELNNAMLRYYAIHGSMPWNAAGATAGTHITVTTGLPAIATLVSAGELKSTFDNGLANLGGSNQLHIVGEDSANSVAVCFDPESKSISNDPSTVFNAAGAGATVVSTGCDNTAASSTCWFCAR